MLTIAYYCSRFPAQAINTNRGGDFTAMEGLWQFRRHCEANFTTLSTFVADFDPKLLHYPRQEWQACTHAISIQLGLIKEGDIDLILTVRERYQNTKYVIKRVEGGVAEGVGPFIMLQHVIFPEVLICKPIRPLPLKVTLKPQQGSDQIEAFVVIGTSQYSSYTDDAVLEFNRSDPKRRLRDKILFWLRFSPLWTLPEIHQPLDIRTHHGTELLTGPERTLGELMMTRLQSFAAVAAD